MSSTHDHHHHQETAPLHDAVDSWHDHSHDAQKPKEAPSEVANAGKIIFTGLALAMVVVVSILVTYAYYTGYVTTRLAEVEHRSTIGPSTDAYNYKVSSIESQRQGGSHVQTLVLVGDQSKLMKATQLPIYNPSQPGTLNEDLLKKVQATLLNPPAFPMAAPPAPPASAAPAPTAK
jgi:hypothetical protein